MSMNSSQLPEHLKKEVILEQIEKNNLKPKSGMEALSLIAHTIMKQLTFRFVGCGDNVNEHESQKFVSEEWNKSSDCHSFLYKHKQSSMTYSIKILKLGSKILINGIALEQNSIFNFEVNISDYIPEKCGFEKLSECFKSNIEEFICQFRDQIAEKLFPTKTTNTTSSSTTVTTSSKSTSIPPYPAPSNPYINPSPLLIQPNPLIYPSPSPFSIGDHDLDPFSLPHPDFGGNLIGPNHPSFFTPTSPLSIGRGRGRGNKPPSVPPDARFDPFGPHNRFGEPDNDHEFGPNGNMYL